MGANSNTNDKYGVPSSWKMAQDILGKRSSSSVKEAQFHFVYISITNSQQNQNNIFYTGQIFISTETMKAYISLLFCLVACALTTAEK